MRHFCVALLVALLVAAVATLPVPRQGELVAPVEPQAPVSRRYYDVRRLPPQFKQLVVQKLEDDMVRAARAGAAAQAVRMEQQLEDEILATAVKKLSAHRGDKAKQAEDLLELEEMVRRDKRAVEALSSVLSSSSGGSSGGGGGEGEEGGGGSNILSLVSSLLGSSSGGGSGGGTSEDGEGGGGGGSNILSLVSGLLGSSSGGGSTGGGGEDGETGGGGSNILSLVSSLLGSSSGGGSTGGGDDGEDGGGGSNILSLVSSVLGSSSGSSSGGGGTSGDGEDGGGGGSNILSLVSGVLGGSSGGGGGGASAGAGKDPLQGGTYDDLIGKGPFTFLSNGMSQVLQFKFTIFRTLFSIITQLLTSSSSAKFGQSSHNS